MDKYPPIAVLPDPQSDEPPGSASPDVSGPVPVATQLGHFNFTVPSRLSPIPATRPISRKRRIASLGSARATKARRTSITTSAVDQTESQLLALDELEAPSGPSNSVLVSPVSLNPKGQKSSNKPRSVGSMSQNTAGRLFSLFKRPSVPNPPPKSAPAKLEIETIVLDSSDDEVTEPALAVGRPSLSQPPPVQRDAEVIDISDSDSDPAPAVSPRRTRPSQDTVENMINIASSSVQKLSPRARLTSVPALSVPVESLPPLPLSSDTEPSPIEQPFSSPRLNPLRARNPPIESSIHGSPRVPQSVTGPDSDSSDGVLETDVIPAGPDEPSVVLNSSGSSSGYEAPSPPKNPVDEPEGSRGRSTTLASPRGRPPTRSSPSGGSAGQSGAATEAELEEIVANVSLHDPQPNPATDKTIAQTVAAVGNIALDDGSERDQSNNTDSHSSGSQSVSSGGTISYKCSVEGCRSRFSAPTQLHTHMSRDHGVRLSQETRKVRRGKRKADDLPTTPTKRHTPASRSDGRTSQASVLGGGSDTSGRSSQSSDHYVERTNTVGFEPFVHSLPPSSSPEPGDDEDEPIVLSGSESSPPRTPAPPVPKLRAPHPNVRPPVPDSPPSDISPSKQLAQKKNEIVIPGEKIDTWRVDIVNSMPESYRNNPNVRVVFEGFMDEAIRENEPCAPAIPVENDVDNQPCPPWEFVYCNRVLYGENVPRADRDALVGCDCLGPCNPNNKDCACVKKQEAYFSGTEELSDVSGFAFNEDGTIRFHHGAIFGCNSKCSCDLECRNKVWQQGRKHKVAIRKTKEKGWGVFAGEFIPAGSYIGIYTGEILTEGITDKRARVYDAFGRTYILNVDFHHLPRGTGAPDYAMDAFHVGNFTRFLNHSCRPNLVLSAFYVEEPDIRRPWMALFSDQDIKTGDELTFSYSGMSADDPEDHAKVKEIERENTKGKSKRGKVFEKCMCGADGCFGILFK